MTEPIIISRPRATEIHRPSRFAFIPLASAIAATDKKVGRARLVHGSWLLASARMADRLTCISCRACWR